jgi:hypothetical protein
LNAAIRTDTAKPVDFANVDRIKLAFDLRE